MTEPDQDDDAQCRICFEPAGGEECRNLCDCSSVAHPACVQKWIKMRASATHAEDIDVGTCEVCGAAWRGTFEVPDDAARPAKLSQDELCERMRNAVEAAWLRVGQPKYFTATDKDREVLARFGPHFDGPWNEPAARKRAGLLTRGRATISSFFSSSKK